MKTRLLLAMLPLVIDSSVWPLVAIPWRHGTVSLLALAPAFQDNSCYTSLTPALTSLKATLCRLVMMSRSGTWQLLHGCTVAVRVLVGMGTTILDGAVVEDENHYRAGSLVPPGKRLESGFMYIGVASKNKFDR